jgi:hypothetical protein
MRGDTDLVSLKSHARLETRYMRLGRWRCTVRTTMWLSHNVCDCSSVLLSSSSSACQLFLRAFRHVRCKALVISIVIVIRVRVSHMTQIVYVCCKLTFLLHSTTSLHRLRQRSHRDIQLLPQKMASSSNHANNLITKDDANKKANEWETRVTKLIKDDEEEVWNEEQDCLYRGLVSHIPDT